jgi:hypothetical protein
MLAPAREVPMSIELSKEARYQAIVSIECYFRENMEEKIGNITAAAPLNFLLEESGSHDLQPCRGRSAGAAAYARDRARHRDP